MHKRFSFLPLFLVVILMTAPTFAQLELGVQGGVNVTTLRGDNINGEEIDFESRNGLALGGIVGFLFGDALCLYLQPMLLQKGAVFQAADAFEIDTTLFGNPEVAFELAYLEVPIMLRFDFADGPFKPYLMAGGSVALHLGSDFAGEFIDLPVEADLTDVIETLEFSADAGLGFRYDFSVFSLFAEAHYQYGFTDILKGGELEIDIGGVTLPVNVPDLDIRGSGFRAIGGLSFRIGG